MRRLYNEELEVLSDEFISYLILNGIDAEEWKKIKNEDVEKAELNILEFSNNYFNVMISGIEYVTFNVAESVHTIQFRSQDRSEFLFKQSENATVGFKETPFLKNRELDIFQLLENGYKPDKGEAYKKLALLYAQSQMK